MVWDWWVQDRIWIELLQLQGEANHSSLLSSIINQSKLYDGMTMIELWETGYYTFFSFSHKLGEFMITPLLQYSSRYCDISECTNLTLLLYRTSAVAPLYYAENLRSGGELGSSKYYLKSAWSNLENSRKHWILLAAVMRNDASYNKVEHYPFTLQ